MTPYDPYAETDEWVLPRYSGSSKVPEAQAAMVRVRALADAFADDDAPRYGGNIAWHIEEAIANEQGDFPDAADQRIASQRARAESALAEVERLREGIRALTDEWEASLDVTYFKNSEWAQCLRANLPALRALLSQPPAATTGEACNCGWGGVHDPDNPRCDANRPAPVSSGERKACGHHPDLLCGCGVIPEQDQSAEAARFLSEIAAPVSSGEAGTGEAGGSGE